MATNSGSNDNAAKMIGAQLQSLLKIPPIKKQEELLDAGLKFNDKPSAPHLAGKEAEGKENDLGREPSRADIAKAIPSKPVSPVARDRFGRPFQSIDRRGRGGGRDYVNGPKRTSGGNKREVVQVMNPPPDRVPVDIRGSGHSNSKTNQPLHTDQNTSSSTEKTSISIGKISQSSNQLLETTNASVSNTKAVPSMNNFDDERSTQQSKCIPYEQPPRFLEEPNRPRVDTVDPAIRQLVQKPDCPQDFRDCVNLLTDNLFCNQMYFLMRRHGVQCLQRKSLKFPRAKYYCACCNYHMDTLYACLSHIMQERHSCLERMHNISATLRMIPDPSPEHASYLTDLLVKTSKLHGMNNTEHVQRLDIVRRITEYVKENNLDCQVSLFGSSLSAFGFRDSNVNINVNVGNEPSSTTLDSSSQMPSSPRSQLSGNNAAEFSEITSKLLGIIKMLPHVSEHKVKEVYTPKCVSIHFEEDKCRSSCVVHFNNTSAVLAAQLFEEYNQIDARVKPLVLCFRYWARMCDLDDQEKGFLPAHCYTIMVIYFLQRVKNILPILHTIPRVQTDGRPFASAREAKTHWSSDNKESIGDLWLGLLKYYSVDFDYKTTLVSISRDNVKIPESEKQWNRRLCIEDPILPKSNLSRSITYNKVCDYIIDRIKLTYLYFGVPREESGPLYDGIAFHTYVDPSRVFKFVKEPSKPTSSQALQRMVRQIQGFDLKNETKSDGDWNWNTTPEGVEMIKHCWKQDYFNYVLDTHVKKLHEILFKKEHYYDFKQENFTDGSLPPIICKACGAEGHLRANCPDETVPPYFPVEYPNIVTLSRLNHVIALNYDREALDTHDVAIRKRIVDEIKSIVLPAYPHVCLTLFGSTFNGFGLHSSDIDICFTLTNVDIPPGERGIRMIDVNEVLENLVNALKASGRVTDVLSIPSAKVPIVKFHHVASRLEADISLYNRLSIYNTDLLKLYVNFDNRVALLGSFLKKLVKLCDVGDASKGSLSSYGYILMLVHFLQNHSVPVLPVLQELEIPGHRVETFYCDNHLVKYLKDLSFVPAIWDGYGKNRESIGQLFLAFLNYYVEKFDFEKYVVTISHSAPLTRVAKCWYTEGIAIEDPFDKTHNLGLGLTRRMSVHILRTFQKFRTFFHRSTDHLRSDGSLLDYYFDVRNIRDGNPPIDRQCRLCSRIGHIAKNCTYVNKQEEDGNRRVRGDDGGGTISREIPLHPDGQVSNNSRFLKQGKQVDFAFPKEEIPTVKVPMKLDTHVHNPWSSESVQHPHLTNPLENGILPSQLTNGIAGFDSNVPQSYPGENDVGVVGAPVRKGYSRSADVKVPLIYNREELEEPKPAVEPVKGVVFFGDIGSTNSDGEQIQAMLQKNEGVTFAFNLGRHQNEAGQCEILNSTDMSPPVDRNIGSGLPPPGFCPPGNMYMTASHNSHPFMQEQASRPVIPTPPGGPGQPFSLAPVGMAPQGAYGHTHPGMSIPFQPVITVATGPFDGRAQSNGDTSERPQVAAATAPPPGFAPLPPAGTNIHPTEMIRNYPQQYAVASVGVMYTVGPIGLNYHPPPNTYTSAPSMIVQSGDPSAVFRSAEGEVPRTIGTANLDGSIMSGAQNICNSVSPHQPHSNLAQYHAFHHHAMPMNVGIPSGPQMESDESGNPSNYHKTTSVAAEPMYNSSEYGGVMTGTPSASSYGLSLSQAHHGPVVSALQMQHSQHHPMQLQGGHFHHPSYQNANVRPFLPLGAYGGSPFSFPTMNVPPGAQHGGENYHYSRHLEEKAEAAVLESKHMK